MVRAPEPHPPPAGTRRIASCVSGIGYVASVLWCAKSEKAQQAPRVMKRRSVYSAIVLPPTARPYPLLYPPFPLLLPAVPSETSSYPSMPVLSPVLPLLCFWAVGWERRAVSLLYNYNNKYKYKTINICTTNI
jgi:hypothetical protein